MSDELYVDGGRVASTGEQCQVCDDPIVAHDGRHVVDLRHVPAIQDAVDHVNDHPSMNVRDGDLEYVVELGYYPGDMCHFVDLSDVDQKYRHSASIDVMARLAERGLAVNSVRWDPPRFHVIHADAMSYADSLADEDLSGASPDDRDIVDISTDERCYSCGWGPAAVILVDGEWECYNCGSDPDEGPYATDGGRISRVPGGGSS